MIKLKDILNEERGPCWKGYQQVGMKEKGGKEVPNCVPESVSINEVVSKTFKIPTQRGILHIEVEEDPAGIFVDVIFNKVEVTMTDIQFPTGEVKITQKQKRVKLKEGSTESVIKEAGGVPMYNAYLALSTKVRNLEDAQKALAKKYFAEKELNKKTALLQQLKKGTEELKKWRARMVKVETDYVMNLDVDAELELT